MTKSKKEKALEHFNGHKGPETIKHVEKNISKAYPNASKELTGVQYGKVMSVANTSYQDGKASNLADMWDYDGPTSWIMGIRGQNVWIEVDGDVIKLNQKNINGDTVVKIYQEVK